MDMSAIASAISGLGAAAELGKTLVGLKVSSEVQAKALELNMTLLSVQSSAIQAQQEQSALLKSMGVLEAEIAKLKDWSADQRQYELADAGQGVLAYRRKPGTENNEPVHWLCPNCYQDRKRSILQPEILNGGRLDILFCPACKTELVVRGDRPPPESSRRGGTFGRR